MESFRSKYKHDLKSSCGKLFFGCNRCKWLHNFIIRIYRSTGFIISDNKFFSRFMQWWKFRKCKCSSKRGNSCLQLSVATCRWRKFKCCFTCSRKLFCDCNRSQWMYFRSNDNSISGDSTDCFNNECAYDLYWRKCKSFCTNCRWCISLFCSLEHF